jgi:hypothetical protein
MAALCGRTGGIDDRAKFIFTIHLILRQALARRTTDGRGIGSSRAIPRLSPAAPAAGQRAAISELLQHAG